MGAFRLEYRKWNKNRGSSSVLVILIMVTLIVLGLIALMSTYSELKLARKNADWVKGYYALDSKAERTLSRINTSLEEADREAVAYLAGKSYEKTGNTGLPDSFQQSVHADWLKAKTAGTEKEFLDQLHQKLYFRFCTEKLKSESQKPNGDDFTEFGITELYETADQSVNGTITVSYTVKGDPMENGRSLMVSLVLKPAEAGGIGARSRASRYEITAWKEIPKKFEYKGTLDFEDPEVW